MPADRFRLWAFGDAHVGTDLKEGRHSLSYALRTSEQGGDAGGPPFSWDIAVDIGDMSGGQAVPEDEEGEEVVRQLGVLEDHGRQEIYHICGNHDRSGLDEPPAWWWRKWVDPTGEQATHSGVDAAARRYPVHGTWERYSFEVGNILFLLMSDINEPSQTIGRGDLGGNPAGVVTGETFDWWCRMVDAHPDRIIQSHPGAVDLWLGGHTHTHPDDTCGGKSHVETGWGGTHFVNVSSLSRYHGVANVPKSRLFNFTEGSDEVVVQCYMHSDEFMPEGWYDEAERKLRLTRPFSWDKPAA